MTKTCGECKHYKMKSKPLEMGICNSHENKGAFTFANSDACDCFKSRERARVITNGDKIRQGGDDELIDFADGIRRRMCHYCLYSKDKSCVDKTGDCWEGVRAWLNAPADCVKQNGDHDTQTALSKADLPLGSCQKLMGSEREE